MQKVFEKILVKLAEKREYYYLNDYVYDVIAVDALDYAIEIVKQIAEEHNNGWIPCSERLPEEYGDYLIIWTDIRGTRFYEICEYEPNEGWIGDIPQAFNGKYSVIAWQLLPEMYKGV